MSSAVDKKAPITVLRQHLQTETRRVPAPQPGRAPRPPPTQQATIIRPNTSTANDHRHPHQCNRGQQHLTMPAKVTMNKQTIHQILRKR